MNCSIHVAAVLSVTLFVAMPLSVQAATTYGDLQHISYTAAENLQATVLFPSEDGWSDIDETTVIVSTVRGAGVELRVNGNLVPVTLLGKRTVDVKTGETRYFFYGVALLPGPNTLTAIPLGTNGLRGTATSETMYGPGAPAALQVGFAGPLVADGASVAPLDITVVDHWGHPAAPGDKLRVTILKGGARFGNSSASVFESAVTPGGYVRLNVQPGIIAGPLTLDFVIGNVHEQRMFYIDPYIRRPFVNGIVNVGAGSMPASVDGTGTCDNGAARRLRTALYANGAIGKLSSLTLAYESQNPLAPLSSYGSFVDDPNERPFLTYGDASQLLAGPASNDHLYLRLERKQDSFTWGQFNADIGTSDVGTYQQLLSGADAEIAAGRNNAIHARAFTARNDVAYIQQVFPVSGLSALEQPLQPDIVVGSDYLQLVALNRTTGAVLSMTPLLRNIDYTIDYATGILRFINIPLPFDQNFNPQAVLVQYQYQGVNVHSQTTGGSLRFDLGNASINPSIAKTTLQFGYVNDATGAENFSLFTQTLAHSWQSGSWSIAHASSSGGIPLFGTINPFAAVGNGGAGDAFSAHLDERHGFDALSLGFQETSDGYNDPFGGLATPGLLTYHAQFANVVPRRNGFLLSVNGQTSRYQGIYSAEQDTTLAYQWYPNAKLSFQGGVLQHVQTGSTITSLVPNSPPASPAPTAVSNGSQMQAHLGGTYQASKRLTFSAETYRTLSGSDVGSTQPTQVLAQANYNFPQKGSLYIRELWSDQPAASFAGSTQALTYTAAATRALQVGFERPLSPMTTVSSDYVVSGTGSAENIYSAVGVQQKFVLNTHMSGNFFVQSANTIGGGSTVSGTEIPGGFTVWGATLAYTNGQRARTTISYQTRAGFGSGSTFSAAIAGKLSPVFSIVGSSQRAYGNGIDAIDDRISIAYRSAESDRFTSLIDYERSNGSYGTDGIGSTIAVQELYRPWRDVELAGEFAYKLNGDSIYVAHTMLTGIRLRKDIGTRFDIGAEVRQTDEPSISGARSADFVSEVGYQLGNSTRLAAGYNFSGSVDPTLLDQPQHKGVYVTATTLVDRIFGWGKN